MSLSDYPKPEAKAAAATTATTTCDISSDLRPHQTQQQQLPQQELQYQQQRELAQAQAQQIQIKQQQQTQKTHQALPSRVSQQRLAKPKLHVAGRLHTHVPSSKGIYANKHQNATASGQVRPPNRRTQSDQRPPHTNSSNGPITGPGNYTGLTYKIASGLKKTSSQTAIARNRSHTEIAHGGRHVSSKVGLTGDCLERNSSGTNISAVFATRNRSSKKQARFDVGHNDDEEADDDDDDEEWQDAGTSASPYITKHTPNSRQDQNSREQHSPSEKRPVKMSMPVSTSATTLVQSPDVRTTGTSDMPTSRFIGNRNGTLTSEGSFYTTNNGNDGSTSLDMNQRIQQATMAANTVKDNTNISDDEDSSRIAYHRTKPKPAEKSRTQQKLDLQRASSVMDTGVIPGAHANPHLMGGGHRLVNVIVANNDGTATRDPRVLKTLEHTDSEYMVVHRFTNPIARCAQRLAKSSPLLKGTNGNGRGHPSLNNSISMPTSAAEVLQAERAAARHSRRISTSSRPGTARSINPLANGAFDELSSIPIHHGSNAEEDNITSILQNMWSTNLDLSVSQ